MVRTYVKVNNKKRPHGSANPADLENAVIFYQNMEKKSLRKAAKEFGVPVSFLLSIILPVPHLYLITCTYL